MSIKMALLKVEKRKGGKVKNRKQAIAIAMHEADIPKKGDKINKSTSEGKGKKTSDKKAAKSKKS